MPSPHPCTDVSLHQQLCSAGWVIPPLRLAEFHSKCPLASHLVTSEACFLDSLPPPPPKILSLQKIWRIFSSSTYGRLKGPMPQGRLGWETLCYWIFRNRIPNLTGSSGTPVVSLSGPYPSSPSFHRCPFCSFQPQWSLCSVDGRIPSVKEWEE